MTEKKTILIVIKHYLPSFKAGGPVRSIEGFVLAFGTDYNIKIITSDRDLNDANPFGEVCINNWNVNGQSKVFYLRRNFLELYHLIKLLRNEEYDLLYLNSFFDKKMSVLPIILWALRLFPRRPLVIAPRGEFSDGALNIKPLRKKIYIKLFDSLYLFTGLWWQASTKYEKYDIERVFHKVNSNNIFIAGDLSSASSNNYNTEITEAPFHSCGALKLVFLSRIARKKNLIYALSILTKLEFNVEFDIYGPIEDQSYWKSCIEIINAMPDHIKVCYKGILTHDAVISTLTNYDLFFLPTLGENYGHVIEEAIHAGIPVLISDQTPWKNLRQIGIGNDLPLSESQLYVDYLEEFYHYTSEQIIRLKKNVLEHSANIVKNKDTIHANRFMIEALFSSEKNTPLFEIDQAEPIKSYNSE